MPLSWYVIERGWEVVDRTGHRVGEVEAVVGDTDADIFDGLRVTTSAGTDSFVTGDRVARIDEDRVVLADDAGALLSADEERPAPPGGAEIRRNRGEAL